MCTWGPHKGGLARVPLNPKKATVMALAGSRATPPWRAAPNAARRGTHLVGGHGGQGTGDQ